MFCCNAQNYTSFFQRNDPDPDAVFTETNYLDMDRCGSGLAILSNSSVSKISQAGQKIWEKNTLGIEDSHSRFIVSSPRFQSSGIFVVGQTNGTDPLADDINSEILVQYYNYLGVLQNYASYPVQIDGVDVAVSVRGAQHSYNDNSFFIWGVAKYKEAGQIVFKPFVSKYSYTYTGSPFPFTSIQLENNWFQTYEIWNNIYALKYSPGDFKIGRNSFEKINPDTAVLAVDIKHNGINKGVTLVHLLTGSGSYVHQLSIQKFAPTSREEEVKFVDMARSDAGGVVVLTQSFHYTFGCVDGIEGHLNYVYNGELTTNEIDDNFSDMIGDGYNEFLRIEKNLDSVNHFFIVGKRKFEQNTGVATQTETVYSNFIINIPLNLPTTYNPDFHSIQVWEEGGDYQRYFWNENRRKYFASQNGDPTLRYFSGNLFEVFPHERFALLGNIKNASDYGATLLQTHWTDVGYPYNPDVWQDECLFDDYRRPTLTDALEEKEVNVSSRKAEIGHRYKLKIALLSEVYQLSEICSSPCTGIPVEYLSITASACVQPGQTQNYTFWDISDPANYNEADILSATVTDGTVTAVSSPEGKVTVSWNATTGVRQITVTAMVGGCVVTRTFRLPVCVTADPCAGIITGQYLTMATTPGCIVNGGIQTYTFHNTFSGILVPAEITLASVSNGTVLGINPTAGQVNVAWSNLSWPLPEHRTITVFAKINGCKVSKTFLLPHCLPGKPTVTTYPSPAIDKVNFHVDGEYTGELQVELIDVNGLVVYRNKYNKNSKNLTQQLLLPATIPNGIYSLVVKGNSFITTNKIVVAK